MGYKSLTLALFVVVLGSSVGSAKNSLPTQNDGQTSPGHLYCGQRLPPSRKRVRRVIGGDVATAHAWPWQVMILNGSSIYCSGSIISPTWLLTSGHCVDQTYNRTIYVGKHRIDEVDEDEQKLEVEKIYTHKKYVHGTDYRPGDYDMALINLKYPIKFSSLVHAVCLPGENNPFEPGHQCMLSGWGIMNYTTKETSILPRQVALPLVAQDVCNSNESYAGIINRRYFCAGVREGGKDGCIFDSGGPLVCSHDSKTWFQLGMMSWGDGCAAPMKYGVYFNVTETMTMIRNHVKDLPKPYVPTPKMETTTSDSGISDRDERKERLFIAIICTLCVIIIILLSTLCIIHFHSKGYICCIATEIGNDQQTANTKPSKLLETNGKLNREVSV